MCPWGFSALSDGFCCSNDIPAIQRCPGNCPGSHSQLNTEGGDSWGDRGEEGKLEGPAGLGRDAGANPTAHTHSFQAMRFFSFSLSFHIDNNVPGGPAAWSLNQLLGQEPPPLHTNLPACRLHTQQAWCKDEAPALAGLTLDPHSALAPPLRPQRQGGHPRSWGHFVLRIA